MTSPLSTPYWVEVEPLTPSSEEDGSDRLPNTRHRLISETDTSSDCLGDSGNFSADDTESAGNSSHCTNLTPSDGAITPSDGAITPSDGAITPSDAGAGLSNEYCIHSDGVVLHSDAGFDPVVIDLTAGFDSESLHTAVISSFDTEIIATLQDDASLFDHAYHRSDDDRLNFLTNRISTGTKYSTENGKNSRSEKAGYCQEIADISTNENRLVCRTYRQDETRNQADGKANVSYEPISVGFHHDDVDNQTDLVEEDDIEDHDGGKMEHFISNNRRSIRKQPRPQRAALRHDPVFRGVLLKFRVKNRRNKDHQLVIKSRYW